VRLYAFGPRIFGLRTGISIGPEDFRPRARRVARHADCGGLDQGQFIYVVRGDHGLLKAGISSNPVARLAQLRTASPFPLEMVYVAVAGGLVEPLERRVHAALANNRCNGEWFDCPLSHVVAAIHGCATDMGLPIQPAPHGYTPEQFVNGIFQRLAARGGDVVKKRSRWHLIWILPLALLLGALAGLWIEFMILLVRSTPP
jgi:Meiotically up-regulated gene 113